MIQARKKIAAGFMIIASFLFIAGIVFCAEPDKDTNKEVTQDNTKGYVGEFLDTRVPEQNYNFVKNALTVFSNRWGPAPKTEKEKEGYVWDQLLLSYEAFRRNIAVTQEEIDTEISNIMLEYKVDFDWKTNQDAFNKWVQAKAGEPTEFFENQLRHLLQIEKLRQNIIEGIQPKVSEEEAHQSFFNEYSSLSIELAQFDNQKEAEDFYQQVKRKPKLWDSQKEKNPNAFRKPGFVTLQFLMDIWKFPKDSVYNMIKMKPGQFYGPSPIYKGYAVFQILETRPADEKEFAKVKERYFDKVKKMKQYQGYHEWLARFKQEAKIKVYQKEGGQQE
jgi:hypothetical protein